MKIVVFGASGQVGQKVVQKLLVHGHTVRAFVHGHDPFVTTDRLKVVQGDIHDRDSVAKAINNCDAVVSTLGSWGTKSKDILSNGMANVIPAMEAAGVQRIVSLTGAAAMDATDRPTWMDRLSHRLLRVMASSILEDGEKHLALLRASKLDWTVVRSPVMKELGQPDHYQLTTRTPLPWATIIRDDVASAITELLEHDQFVRSAPFIQRT